MVKDGDNSRGGEPVGWKANRLDRESSVGGSRKDRYMQFLNIIYALNRTGVMEMGRKSAGETGEAILKYGKIIEVFHSMEHELEKK